jgi:hypothetical protein
VLTVFTRNEAVPAMTPSVKSECTRNRGTDCENPQTLRDMEAQRMPGGTRNNPAYRY